MNTKALTLILAVAASGTLLSACSRSDPNHTTANPADIRADSVPPASVSTTPTTPPPLPPTPALPEGAGDAKAPASSAAAAPAPAPSKGTGDARDTAANAPTGGLSAQEESSAMPKAGQTNNHSSTAMEESRGQTPQR